MRIWTVHLDEDAAPVLIPEGFSWGAMLFGPVWLAAHRDFVPAGLSLIPIVVCLLVPGVALKLACLVLLAVTFGLAGNDLRRWAMGLRGRPAVHVIAAKDEEAAFLRLMLARPDLAAQAAE